VPPPLDYEPREERKRPDEGVRALRNVAFGLFLMFAAFHLLISI